jgi:hypothetical protein
MRVFLSIVTVVLFCSPCLARDIHVSKSGRDADGSGGGNAASPYLTIKHALRKSNSGDTVHVHAGTYAESWLELKEGTRLVSADGLHKARIYSGKVSAIRLTNDNSGIDGFEVYGDQDQGRPGDGLIRPIGSKNVWIKNCKVHDAPSDCDVIKVGARDVLIENCIIYNPGHRGNGQFQECIDIFGRGEGRVDGVVVRGCWIYHTPEKGGDYLLYAKGGAKNILWENNVFGPAGGGGHGNVSTGCGAASPAVFPSCENFIARNNIFVGCAGDGAFGFTGAKNAHVYNNVFFGYKGNRAFIQFYSAQPGGKDRNEDCYVFNNIFVQSNGKPVYLDRGRYSGKCTYLPENFQSDYNIYHQVNTSVPANDVEILKEKHSLFEDPKLAAPGLPDTSKDTWKSIVARFLLQEGSPAVNRGKALSAAGSYNVPLDILGSSRPVAGRYDIGVHEYGKK